MLRSVIGERLGTGLVTAALIGLGVTCADRLSMTAAVERETGDIGLYETIVERVRAGEPYYDVAGQELHARGYATAPFVNWRLPTLAVVQAALPRRASVWLLTPLGLLTAVVWAAVLLRFSPVRAWIGVPLLLTMLQAWRSESAGFLHELWAGQLVALSLGLRLAGATRTAVAVALAAVAIRELSLGYIVVMSAWAVGDGRRREAGHWLLVAAAGLAFTAWHAVQVWPHVPADGLRNTWFSLGGWCVFLRAARASLAFAPMPALLLALVVPVAWMGLIYRARFTPLPLVVSVYVIAFMALARPDNWYWGLMIAPLLPLGVLVPGPVHPPDAEPRTGGPLPTATGGR